MIIWLHDISIIYRMKYKKIIKTLRPFTWVKNRQKMFVLFFCLFIVTSVMSDLLIYYFMSVLYCYYWAFNWFDFLRVHSYIIYWFISDLEVDFLDTEGDMQFPAMRRLSIANASAFMLVYRYVRPLIRSNKLKQKKTFSFIEFILIFLCFPLKVSIGCVLSISSRLALKRLGNWGPTFR